jgi:hypothetical protein
VTGPSPYTPPQSNVRDRVPSRHEKRVLRGLSKLLNDEDRRARRNRVYRLAFAVAGVLCVGLAVVVGEADRANVVWAALLGALGGYLVAISALPRDQPTATGPSSGDTWMASASKRITKRFATSRARSAPHHSRFRGTT